MQGMRRMNKEPNRELTNETFEFDEKDIFHFVGGDYKPWWSPCDKGDLHVRGYNGCSPSDIFFDILEEATEDGRIVKKDENGDHQDYLIEVHVKVTKLKRLANQEENEKDN